MSKGYGLFWNEDLYNTELTDKEFRLLCSISNLCAENGECRAGNKFFSEKFSCSPETATRNIKELEKKQVITIRYEGNGTSNKKRFIKLTNGQKTQEPIDKNVNVNNTRVNNNIISKDINIIETEVSERKTNIKIMNDNIISPIKIRAELKGLFYDRKDERIWASHISKDKEIWRICELKKIELPFFVKSVLEIADKFEFWQDKLLSTKSFYYNWRKILNEHKNTNKVDVAKADITQEQKTLAQQQLDKMLN